MFFRYGINGIVSNYNGDSWMIVLRIFDCLLHGNGQLQSIIMVGLFVCVCYSIGLRFRRLTKNLRENAHRRRSSFVGRLPKSIMTAARFEYFKSLYMTIVQAVCKDLNRAFGLAVLFILAGRLIGCSINCYRLLIHQQSYAFLPLSLDLLDIFFIFQAADYVHNQVELI